MVVGIGAWFSLLAAAGTILLIGSAALITSKPWTWANEFEREIQGIQDRNAIAQRVGELLSYRLKELETVIGRQPTTASAPTPDSRIRYFSVHGGFSALDGQNRHELAHLMDTAPYEREFERSISEELGIPH